MPERTGIPYPRDQHGDGLVHHLPELHCTQPLGCTAAARPESSSYSGVNDYTVPIIHEQADTFLPVQPVEDALAIAARGRSGFPPGAPVAARRVAPTSLTRTTVGYGVKYAPWTPDYFTRISAESYQASSVRRWGNPNQFLDEAATPLYVHAFALNQGA